MENVNPQRNRELLCVTMLGTGNAAATKCYNTCFLLSRKNRHFLVDAGGGNQIFEMLSKQGVALTNIHDLFVTHAHSDHILGAVWVIRMIGQRMRKNAYEGNLKIYACAETAENLRTICRITLVPKITELFGSRIEFIILEDGESHRILDYDVIFFDIHSAKLRQYAFEIREIGLLFCGDEPLKSEYYEKARGCSYLLHEAFCLYAERERFKPYEKHHSTVKDVCMMAESLQVKNLILMHTEDSHIESRKKRYEEEGKEFFHGNLLIPDDGESFAIK